MTKTYKAVLRSSLVMLCLLAPWLGSGVAQAQECFARLRERRPQHGSRRGLDRGYWRASQLQCRAERDALALTLPGRRSEISIELNTADHQSNDWTTTDVTGHGPHLH